MCFNYTKYTPIVAYVNYKIQITFVKATKYKIGLRNTLNVFQIQHFKYLYLNYSINGQYKGVGLHRINWTDGEGEQWT